MSLDIYLYVDERCVFDANITHNLNTMADKAGMYEVLWRPDECNPQVEYTHQLIPVLQSGICKMVCNPAEFKELDASNGWGTYDDFVPWPINLLEACQQYPNAKIEVSR